MNNRLQDYLHLYLGCEIQAIRGWRNYTVGKKYTLNTAILNDFEVNLRAGNIICKPLLRPLSDMTEEEFKEVFKPIQPLDVSQEQYDDAIKSLREDGYESLDFGGIYAPRVFELFKELLSKHFDLFGLIEAGLAIDKTKLNQTS